MDGKLISDAYRAQNHELHTRKKEKWGNDGHKRAIIVRDFADEIGAHSILDYGCGRGTLRMALKDGGKKIKGMGWHGKVYEYDPALPKKNKAHPADLVACTDVLEHVEPELLTNVLQHIASLALLGAFLLVSTRPANKILPDGRNAHLIVENADWWFIHLHDEGLNVMAQEIYSNQVLFWVRM